MAIQAILLDIEGVLLRKGDTSGERTWEERLHLDEGKLRRTLDRTGIPGSAIAGRITATEAWQSLGERLTLNEQETQELSRALWSSYELNRELIDYLQSLRPQYKVATVSNGWSDEREILSNKFGLDKLVDDMFISSEVGLTKVDVRLFQLAISRLRVRPEDTIFVDDDASAFDGAWLLGMKAVRFTSNQQTIAAIQKYLS